jgi:hypothetical protein
MNQKLRKNYLLKKALIFQEKSSKTLKNKKLEILVLCETSMEVS